MSDPMPAAAAKLSAASQARRSPAPRARLSTESVVDAAIALIDEHGRTALTLAALAGRTGVAAPSLYKHVSSLEALQQKVSARVTAELGQVLSASIAGRSRQDALRAIAHAYRDYAVAHPGRYAFTQQVPNADDPGHVAAGALAVQTVFATLRGYGLEGEDAIDATRVIRSALHGFVSLEVDGGFGLPQDIGRTFDRLVAALHVSVSSWDEIAR